MSLRLEELINSDVIESFLKGRKITVLESLILTCMKINRPKTVLAINETNRNIFLKSMGHKELNIAQSLEVLDKINNHSYINESNNCNEYCSFILKNYLEDQRNNNRKYKNLSLVVISKAFYFSLKINKGIAYRQLENEFLSRLKEKKIEPNRMSMLFQFFKRIELMTKSKYLNAINDYLENNKEQFILSLNNLNIEKITSGLVELSKCELKYYADQFLFDARKPILNKIRKKEGDDIIWKKIYPDVKSIAIDKSLIVLKETKKSLPATPHTRP